MNHQVTSLTAAFKNTDAFGIANAADFLPASMGGQQFALIHAAVPQTATLGAAQVSGADAAHSSVMDKVAGRFHLHDDLLGIANAAHSLALLGTAGLDGKFLMPRSGGDQALLNSARAFQTDAATFSAPLISLGLPATFLTQLGTDTTAFEAFITAKGAGMGAQSGATGGLEDTAHKAARLPCTSSKPSCPTSTKTIRPNSPNGRPPATLKNTRPSRAQNLRRLRCDKSGKSINTFIA